MDKQQLQDGHRSSVAMPSPPAPPSFASPEPALTATRALQQQQRTLSERARKKHKHRTLQRQLPLPLAAKALALTLTPTATASNSTTPVKQAAQRSLDRASDARARKMRRKVAMTKKNKKKKSHGRDMNTSKSNSSTNGTDTDTGTGKRVSENESTTRKLTFATTTTMRTERGDGVSSRSKKSVTEQDETVAASSAASSSSSSSSSSSCRSSGSSSEGENEKYGDGDGDVSSASSDECEVTFDARTLGNMRIVREAAPPLLLASPLSTTSMASSTSMPPIGLEFRFSVRSTVSSIAVAPNGKFLVVGFYDGTIYVYPLTQDALRFRTGVLLARISARGLYTQLMVRVALPEDGKFIFAGVYRGSTEIRAFEVDSIKLPTLDDDEDAGAAWPSSPRKRKRPTGTETERKSSATQVDCDNDVKEANAEADEEEDSEHELDGLGLPIARAISHTYSDAKLKGFSAVKSVVRESNQVVEYHLLCGLGIKNIHLWRFFRSDASATSWSWECILDKQSNGISIEMLCFHHDNSKNQFISKSEHQNIRVWDLEEDETSRTMKKISFVDVKQTVDAQAVYGHHAYGGGEALALIDLRTSSRMELDLPLSVRDQEANEARAINASSSTRMTAALRGRRSSRRSGGGVNDDSLGTNNQRLMRMVSQVAGRDSAPFVIGMCTDGSVFMHNPQPEVMGVATPLEAVDGYEQFFQTQFTDPTRANRSGLLAVVPLPESEKEDWMVVAANGDQLLVRSLKAFLQRNEQHKEHAHVKRELRHALKDMGKHSSESETDDAGSDSASDYEGTRRSPVAKRGDDADRRKHVDKKVRDPTESVSTLSGSKKVKRDRVMNTTTSSVEANHKEELGGSLKRVVSAGQARDKGIATGDKLIKRLMQAKAMKTAAEGGSAHIPVKQTKQLPPLADTTGVVGTTGVVVTPTRRPRRVDALIPGKEVVPSPVVSISSPSSASSNPNTPEQVVVDTVRRSVAVKELQWSSVETPKHSEEVTTSAANGSELKSHVDDSTRAHDAQVSTQARPTASVLPRRGRPVKKSKTPKSRTKVAQALFVTPDEKENDTISCNHGSKEEPAPSEDNGSTGRPGTSHKRKASDQGRKSSKKMATLGSGETSAIVPNDASCTIDDGDACTDVEMEDTVSDPELEVTYSCSPLASDGNALLAAATYQYNSVMSSSTVNSTTSTTTVQHSFSIEEINLLMRFAKQTSRLQQTYDHDRRLLVSKYAKPDCECNKKKASFASSAVTGSRLNWRKEMVDEVGKKKHMKRRHKKHLAAKLKDLQQSYHAKLDDARAMQRLELQAYTARQAFDALLSDAS